MHDQLTPLLTAAIGFAYVGGIGFVAIGAYLRSSVLSVVGVVVIANLLYGAVFTPHLVAKLEGWETAGPTAPLFPGVPNQPLQGTGPAPGRTRSGSSVAPPRPRRSPEAALPTLLTNR